MQRYLARTWSSVPRFCSSPAPRVHNPQQRPLFAMSAFLPVDTLAPKARDVLDYWFSEGWAISSHKYAYPPQPNVTMWWRGGEAVDKDIRDRFEELHFQIAAGELDDWRSHPLNALAAIIVMDQMSRNMFRGTPKAFATDSKALAWTKHYWEQKWNEALPVIVQTFLVLPLMHSEVLEDQETCVSLTKSLRQEVETAMQTEELPDGATVVKYLTGTVDAAGDHRDLIATWGRFPHRNGILGRESTPEEAAGIADGTIKRF